MRRTTLLPLVLLFAFTGGLLARARAEPPVETAPPPSRVSVPKGFIDHDDGDSFEIHWLDGPEVVRILGMDTPETAHPDHDIPYAQPFGEAAAGFLRGCMAMATRVELLRAADKDPYGRTLGYIFLDGRNYSVLAVEARLAVENVRHFGDNGFPAEAAAVLEAAQKAGPVPFEPPHRFRSRMRRVSEWMRERDATVGEQDGEDEGPPK